MTAVCYIDKIAILPDGVVMTDVSLCLDGDTISLSIPHYPVTCDDDIRQGIVNRAVTEWCKANGNSGHREEALAKFTSDLAGLDCGGWK